MKHSIITRAVLLICLLLTLSITGCGTTEPPSSSSNEDVHSKSEINIGDHFDEFPSLMTPVSIDGVLVDDKLDEIDSEKSTETHKYYFKVDSSHQRSDVIKKYYESAKSIEAENTGSSGMDSDSPSFWGEKTGSDGSIVQFRILTDYDNADRFIVSFTVRSKEFYSEKKSVSENASKTLDSGFKIVGTWEASETYDRNTYERNDVPAGAVWINFNEDGTYEWTAQTVYVTGTYMRINEDVDSDGKKIDQMFVIYNGYDNEIIAGVTEYGKQILLILYKDGELTNMCYICDKKTS